MRIVGRLALVGALLLNLGSTSAAAPVPTAATVDLREAYVLLTTTFYSQIDPQKMLDGARSALAEDLRVHHVSQALPALRNKANETDNVAQIDDAISRVATLTHEDATRVAYVAIAGMTSGVGDRYTTFFTPDQLKEFNDALDPEKISGIGVLIEPDPATQDIRAYFVVPGTPAERAGIQAGDVFANVDGKPTKGLDGEHATAMLRGRSGTVVHVDVVRDGKPLGTLALTRTEVSPPTVVFKMLPESIGYINIIAFGRDTPEQFNTALDRLQSSGAQAYVLDLRNDGGGYVNSALDISAKFINTDPIVTVEDRGSRLERIDADGEAISPKPLTILVNRYTASASEITAGALQDDGVGILVGEKTFGKGVVQTLTPLPDGAAIKITTARYFTPKNHDINLKGIVPDVSVAENKNDRFGDPTHDTQLQAAVSLLEKKIADAKP